MAATVAISARRDYGANPKGPALAKSHERALNEASRARPADSAPGSGASLSDSHASIEEESWGLDSAMGAAHEDNQPSGNGTLLGTSRGANGLMGRTSDQTNGSEAPLASAQGAQQHSPGAKTSVCLLKQSRQPSQHESLAPTEPEPDEQERSTHWSGGNASAASDPVYNSMLARPAASPDEKMRPHAPPQQGTDAMHHSASLASGHCKDGGMSNSANAPDVQELAASACTAAMKIVGTAASASTAHRDPRDRKQAEAQQPDENPARAPGRPPCCQGMLPTELEKLRAMSQSGQQRAPQWVSEELSADLRLARKLQEEELRWHQIHSRADAAKGIKRKLKKESTLDAFFKKPAR